MVRFLCENGLHFGLPTLQAQFPELPRAALREILQAWREHARRHHTERYCRLEWTRPGAVWGADFTRPPEPIDGLFPSVLMVRDLASGYVLAAEPVAAEDAPSAHAVLSALLEEHGPPLVLKLDNGSAFIETRFRSLVRRHAVRILYSPPHTPSFNGSVEAGNGWFKRSVRHAALRAGRAWWTVADLATARDQCNRVRRPRGPSSLTPARRWSQRRPLCAGEREGFLAFVAKCEHEERARRELAITKEVSRSEQASIGRHVLSRSLEECGFLRYRRGRITPAISRR